MHCITHLSMLYVQWFFVFSFAFQGGLWSILLIYFTTSLVWGAHWRKIHVFCSYSRANVVQFICNLTQGSFKQIDCRRYCLYCSQQTKISQWRRGMPFKPGIDGKWLKAKYGNFSGNISGYVPFGKDRFILVLKVSADERQWLKNVNWIKIKQQIVECCDCLIVELSCQCA